LLHNGGVFTFSGGTLTGTVRGHGAQVDVANSVTQPSTLRLVGDGNVLVKNDSPGVTLWLEGTTTWGYSRLYVDQDASNRGTLRLETTSADNGNQNCYPQTRNNARLLNEATGVTASNAGAGDSRILSGTLVNRGRLDAATLTTFQGYLEAAGGSY